MQGSLKTNARRWPWWVALALVHGSAACGSSGDTPAPATTADSGATPQLPADSSLASDASADSTTQATDGARPAPEASVVDVGGVLPSADSGVPTVDVGQPTTDTGAPISDLGPKADTQAPPTADAAVVSVRVSAATGGTVAGSGVQLQLPAGALASDTTITVQQLSPSGLPDEANIGAAVYDFGPDGVTFNKPVSLSITLTRPVPPGQAAKIAFLRDGHWTPLTDSTASGTQVTATTTHFTPFTIIFTASAQTGGQCGGTFTVCGGDLRGVWHYTAACMNMAIPGGGLFEGCPSATSAITLNVIGTVEFQATSYSANSTSTVSAVTTIPKSCLPPTATCAQFDATEAGDSCAMTREQPPSINAETGTYSVSDGHLYLTEKTEDGGTKLSDLEYCVTGNTAAVREVEADGNEIRYTLER